MKNFNIKKFESFLLELLAKDQKKSQTLSSKTIDLQTIDPFSALLECSTLNVGLDEWIETPKIAFSEART